MTTIKVEPDGRIFSTLTYNRGLKVYTIMEGLHHLFKEQTIEMKQPIKMATKEIFNFHLQSKDTTDFKFLKGMYPQFFTDLYFDTYSLAAEDSNQNSEHEEPQYLNGSLHNAPTSSF